jgi:pimeloyl-ACP methyl ester carboxylesterase
VSAAAATAEPIEQTVEYGEGVLHVLDRPGQDPALVLMHGFPDDHHVYDRLAPLLAPHRIVTFDWLGYGKSSRRKPDAPRRTSRQQELTASPPRSTSTEWCSSGTTPPDPRQSSSH